VSAGVATRANWFVALPVRIEHLEARVPPPPRSFRRFCPEDLHATIAFLGASGETLAVRAFEALPDALGPAVSVHLGAVVPMGRPSAYSALSALVSEGRAALEERMTAWRDRILEATGFARESRPMKAHVTLARPSRRASAADRAAGLAWASSVDLHGLEVRLDRIALYTWDDARTERLFRIVCARPLAG
jgi:2'-5' RNA ligase